MRVSIVFDSRERGRNLGEFRVQSATRTRSWLLSIAKGDPLRPDLSIDQAPKLSMVLNVMPIGKSNPTTLRCRVHEPYVMGSSRKEHAANDHRSITCCIILPLLYQDKFFLLFNVKFDTISTDL